MIQQHSQISIKSCFDDGLEVLKYLANPPGGRYLSKYQHSISWMLDGMLLAQNINQFTQKPLIVFITAWKEHAVEAFELELEAFDYILKPYHESRIVTILNKLGATAQQQAQQTNPAASAPQTVNLVKDERIIVTDINDIYNMWKPMKN